MPKRPAPIGQRFWAKVDKNGSMWNGSPCWLWLGGADIRGYCRIRLPKSEGRRRVLVHRLAYELLVGPIPDELTIDHLCRVTRCVNPQHLEVVTGVVNTRRGFGVGVRNAVKTHCVNGHEFSAANIRARGPDGRYRGCRTCHALELRRLRERRRSHAA